jgi:hypothetical protein
MKGQHTWPHQCNIFNRHTYIVCNNMTVIGKSKGTAIPEGSRRLRLPDLTTIGTWRWQGCQPYAPAAFTHKKYSWLLIYVAGWVDPRIIVVRPEFSGQWETAVTQSVIERAALRLVPQCLNQLRYRVGCMRKSQQFSTQLLNWTNTRLHWTISAVRLD